MTADGPLPRHEAVLEEAMLIARRSVDSWPDLNPPQRRGLMVAFAGLVDDLHTLGIAPPPEALLDHQRRDR